MDIQHLILLSLFLIFLLLIYLKRGKKCLVSHPSDRNISFSSAYPDKSALLQTYAAGVTFRKEGYFSSSLLHPLIVFPDKDDKNSYFYNKGKTFQNF